MEYKDTVELMLSSDYKDRFRAEYYQLKIRLKRLYRMIAERATAEQIDGCPIEIHKEQAKIMLDYLNTLEIRAIVEGIEL